MDIKKDKNRIIKLTAFTVLALLSGVILYLIFVYTGAGFRCPFNLLTGLKCPGCGNTHVITCLLKLDFAGAFRANYMFLPEFLYILWVYIFAAKNYLSGGRFNYIPPVKYIDIIFLVLLILWWIIRNIFHI